MQSGDYNEPFEIQRVDYEINANGDQQKTYTTVYAGYAKVINLSGREFWDALAVQRENTLKFNCRWNERLRDIDTRKHVLTWRNRHLDIIAIDNIAHQNASCTIKAVDNGDH